EFITAAGIECLRVKFENEQNGFTFRQTQYFFANGNSKLVVTCTALAKGGESLDPVFEASMKTFRLNDESGDGGPFPWIQWVTGAIGALAGCVGLVIVIFQFTEKKEPVGVAFAVLFVVGFLFGQGLSIFCGVKAQI